MKFARHAQIFRGPLDAAPVAGVMLLASLVYTPGELIELGQAITVTGSNVVHFAGKSYLPGELGQLRADLKSSPGNAGFSVVLEPGADPALGRQVSNLFQITLPEGNYLTGTDNATVVVAVDFRGHCFYENRLVQDAELRDELARRLRMAAREGRKLTLFLSMDKAAEMQVQTRLRELAREVGITEVRLAGRPAPSGGAP
jgi:biopolymer transport protein ExbD